MTDDEEAFNDADGTDIADEFEDLVVERGISLCVCSAFLCATQ